MGLTKINLIEKLKVGSVLVCGCRGNPFFLQGVVKDHSKDSFGNSGVLSQTALVQDSSVAT